MTPRALHAPARLAGLPLLRTQTDERLVDLVRAGNDAAFEAIVGRYRRPLLHHCSAILSEGQAEDAVQQTFMRALSALRASNGQMALRPWLYRIAHNVSLNALRDRSLRHEELFEGIDGVERPEQAYEKNERLRDTVAAVGALPARQRDAIVLRELEGRSYEEIASELGVTGGAVRQLLNRARGTLRQGMTALVPFGLLARLPAAEGGELTAARLAELCGMGAAGAVASKTVATALVTGAVVAGVAGAPSGGPGDGRASAGPQETPTQTTESRLSPGRVRSEPARSPRDEGAGERSGRRGGDAGDRSGRGSGRAGGGDEDRSGPGGGGREDDGVVTDNSGPGSGGVVTRDNSGPGSTSSGSGSGSGSSGSGTSGSGSSGSGSGSSGSGSGTSGGDTQPDALDLPDDD